MMGTLWHYSVKKTINSCCFSVTCGLLLFVFKLFYSCRKSVLGWHLFWGEELNVHLKPSFKSQFKCTVSNCAHGFDSSGLFTMVNFLLKYKNYMGLDK